jgi:hypothetical protein
MEAEYMAATAATKEAIWMTNLLGEIGFLQEKPTKIYTDSQSSIALTENPVNHARSEHIDIQYHFVRQKLEEGVIETEYLPTGEMVADMLTKPLSGPRIQICVQGSGIRCRTNTAKDGMEQQQESVEDESHGGG